MKIGTLGLEMLGAPWAAAGGPQVAIGSCVDECLREWQLIQRCADIWAGGTEGAN